MQKTVKRGIWMNSLLNLPVGKSSGEHWTRKLLETCLLWWA